jgi:hypothetical protein
LVKVRAQLRIVKYEINEISKRSKSLALFITNSHAVAWLPSSQQTLWLSARPGESLSPTRRLGGGRAA